MSLVSADKLSEYTVLFTDASLTVYDKDEVGLLFQFPYYTHDPKSVDLFFFCGGFI